MVFSLNEFEWHYPVMIHLFAMIFLFALPCLGYYLQHHYLLAARLKKQIELFKNLRLAKTPGAEIGLIFDQQFNKARNPPVKDLCRALYALAAGPAEGGERLAQKHKREIDYFLTRRELQIKRLAIVLVFSIAGLLLVATKELLAEIYLRNTYLDDPFLRNAIRPLYVSFRHNLFVPAVFALAETFLAFWLIFAIKKLRLWLDREWTNLP